MSRWKPIVLAALSTGALSSCNPVNFVTDVPSTPSASISGGDDGGGSAHHQGAVSCSPGLNGAHQSATVSTQNPSLAANCSPGSAVTWSVTRGATPVSVSGLNGSSSIPDFIAAGPGLYFITLSATADGWTPYTTSTPLLVTVQNTIVGLPTIVCDPRINGGATSVTLTGSNPTIAANCNPANVAYVWTPVLNGLPIVVPGLSGSVATPDFVGLTPGTYSVFLTASQIGANAYISANPLKITVPPGGGGGGGGGGGTPVHDTVTVSAANNKLDIVLVVDDSNSMLADNQRLASRLEGFVNSLSSLGYDWQMCATLTRAQRVSNSDPNYYWGASVNWAGNSGSPSWILKAGTSNIYSIFRDTIDQIGAGWLGTDDERAIKALWWHLWNGEPGVSGTSGCYRQDAGLAVLILSDEDERSIGGDESQAYYTSEAGKSLETDDLPATYVGYVKQVFGNSKRFTVNSIIVRPGDNQCLADQDADGSKAHFGVKYNELSGLTSGYVGSICDSDYSTNLNYFQSFISTSQASVPLQCSPPAVQAVVTPTMTFTQQLDGARLIFNPQVPAGSTIELDYVCP